MTGWRYYDVIVVSQARVKGVGYVIIYHQAFVLFVGAPLYLILLTGDWLAGWLTPPDNLSLGSVGRGWSGNDGHRESVSREIDSSVLASR